MIGDGEGHKVPIQAVAGIHLTGEREVLAFPVGERENQTAWEDLLDAAKGRKRRYPWGDEWDSSRCNLTPFTDARGSMSVGLYSPLGDSAYGCADMAGNVCEWTSSLYKPYPCDVTDGREDLDAEDRRVLRVGLWFGSPVTGRCSFRDRDDPDFFSGAISFRCVSPISGSGS